MEPTAEMIIEGTVQSVIFQNPENGYTVLRLDAGEEGVTVVGCLPGVSAGEGLRLVGTWTSHQSYGEQFKAEHAERFMPRGTRAIFDYLSSGVIKGVGVKTARLIVDTFGEDSLEIIEDSPLLLTRIKGITEKRALEIGEQYKKQTGLRRLMEFLVDYGVKPFAGARLYKVYGENAREIVCSNPYILADEFYGLDFFEADELAEKLGFDEDSGERLEAAVLFELKHNLGNGHVFLPYGKLCEATAQLISAEYERIENALERLIVSRNVVRDTVAGVDACYLEDMHGAETCVAENLKLSRRVRKTDAGDPGKLIKRVEKACGIEYALEQRRALMEAIDSPVMVITGGPGTGKTTVIKGILEIFDQMGIKTALTAPTGRAAKRLSELTGRDAQTVHRLLGAGIPESGMGSVFEKDEDDKLDCGAVILDETSMVDITLMAALLSAMPDNARLIMVGDADQLPSVGPGNVFGDIIRSEAVPVVRLTEIFRQAEESAIIRNAHLINSGEVPDIVNKGGDFFFLKRGDQESICETITGLISERLPKNMGISSADVQVLSPSRKHGAGTMDLNIRIQAALNPPAEGKKEKTVGTRVLRVGDRVMQTRNNYDIMWYRHEEGEEFNKNAHSGLGIFNGDVGYIKDISPEREYVLIAFDERLVPYPFEMLMDLELAYAVTVHKSQGSEYRAVVLSIPRGAPRLQVRSVLYTAVTRARELLIIVGDPEVFAAMVANDRRQRRYSGLRARLADGQYGHS